MNNPTDNGRTATPYLTVCIAIGNDACESYDDALNVLEYATRRINDGRAMPTITHGDYYRFWPVRDDNGNTIGGIVYSKPRPPRVTVPYEVQS